VADELPVYVFGLLTSDEYQLGAGRDDDLGIGISEWPDPGD
jgi:hypothetical protein